MNQDQVTRNFMIINTTMARMQKQIDIAMDKRLRALEAKVAELEGRDPVVRRGPGRPRKDAEAA